jgi:hypothetical protein
MKEKRSKKRSKIGKKKRLPETASAAASATSAEVVSSQSGSPIMPDPAVLFRQAEEEPDIQTLSAYVDAIRMLRDKGFSYREIADWLSERGLAVDHNAVYRAYTKSLSDYDRYLDDLQEADEAREEAFRNP